VTAQEKKTHHNFISHWPIRSAYKRGILFQAVSPLRPCVSLQTGFATEVPSSPGPASSGLASPFLTHGPPLPCPLRLCTCTVQTPRPCMWGLPFPSVQFESAQRLYKAFIEYLLHAGHCSRLYTEKWRWWLCLPGKEPSCWCCTEWRVNPACKMCDPASVTDHCESQFPHL
jgi:hypothetical protein